MHRNLFYYFVCIFIPLTYELSLFCNCCKLVLLVFFVLFLELCLSISICLLYAHIHAMSKFYKNKK